MIYIVHGDDVSKSRSLIVNHQKKLNLFHKYEVSLKEITPTELLEKCSTTSLFGEPTMCVIDITDSLKTDFDEYINVLKKIPKEAAVVFFAGKNMPKTNTLLKSAELFDAKVLENNSVKEANIFKFTDLLFSKNRKQTYFEYDKLIHEDYDSFYIFGMILYGLRSMAKVFWNAPSTATMKPFQKTKVSSFLNGYDDIKLKKLFGFLYDLEKKSKTGEIDADIAVTFAIEKVLNSL